MTTHASDPAPEVGTSITVAEYLGLLPKVELHCHFPGTIAATTAIELAAKHGLDLPTTDPDELYSYDDIVGFLTVLQAVGATLVDREDFARVAYETLAEGVTKGNLRYREMFFNPDYHTPQGVTYETMVTGMADGIARAFDEFGVRCNLIAAISRFHGPAAAVDMVRTVLDQPHPLVIGIGMDDLTPEGLEAPETFVEAYTLATTNGLRATGHVAEIIGAPADHILVALDVLGCERIDHGYRILEDPAIVERARADQIHFTTCPHSSAWVYGFSFEDHPVKDMVARGLKVSLNSDDPPCFHTDIGREFTIAVPAMGFSTEQAAQFCLDAVEGSWLPDADKTVLRAEFVAEIAALSARLA